MNLRDKLRAVGGPGQPRNAAASENRDSPLDCRHLSEIRPPEEFPGAADLTGKTLALMTEKEMPEALDPRKILYLDTETTGLIYNRDEIIEFAAVVVEKQNWEVVVTQEYDERSAGIRRVRFHTGCFPHCR